MAFMAHQPKALIYIEFKFKMRLRLPFSPEWVRADVAGWLYGEMLLHHESLNVSEPACYDTDSDTFYNIDEFIHVGRRRWDIVGYDMDPIYDIENHFQMFPLELSQQVDQWQQGDDIFTCILQTPKDDLVPCFHDDF
jgi:hypothetical protein